MKLILNEEKVLGEVMVNNHNEVGLVGIITSYTGSKNHDICIDELKHAIKRRNDPEDEEIYTHIIDITNYFFGFVEHNEPILITSNDYYTQTVIMNMKTGSRRTIHTDIEGKTHIAGF